MLDPLSAFAVACNVLQVVEVGVKILSNADEYRKAQGGILSDQKELRDVSQTLNKLNSELQGTLSRKSSSPSHSVEVSRLMEANDQCLRVSQELIIFLDGLKLKEKHVMLDSLRVSIKAMWHKDKRDAMEKALISARDNLNIAILVYMNSKQATHSDIAENTSRVEGTILEAVNSTQNQLQDDIKTLAKQIEHVSTPSVQHDMAQFTASHHDLLEQLSHRIDSILVLRTDSNASPDNDALIATARQNIIDSLQFPQISERRDHVVEAQSKTFQWVLEPEQERFQRWDDFVQWLGAPTVENRIYWVHGKIGAGKTTLLRFIDDKLTVSKHMLPWAADVAIVRASCFLWSAGTKLQKSTTGLLRTLLSRLFEQTPNLVPQVVPAKKWQVAGLSGKHVIDWTDSELRNTFQEYIRQTTMSNKVFILIDGLDEFEGSDEMRQSLIDLLVDAAANANVKLCLSSRPWNIFQDAFGSCPQLRLEDLNYNDIDKYIQGELSGNRRYQQLLHNDEIAAGRIVKDLMSKAAGVFLWVRLVVRQLLRGLRDGDNLRTLESMIEESPEDLNEYFMRLMQSIEPRHRKEASQLFQLALYEETDFVSLHSSTLLEFSFIGEGRPDFALASPNKSPRLDLQLVGAMEFRLESTVRKVNSRCMGLLECGLEIPLNPAISKDASSIYRTALVSVELLHRSLRDFLLTDDVQSLLHHHAQGPFDVRMFFRSARLAELQALTRVNGSPETTIGLASYVLSTLTIPDYKETSGAAAFATLMEPIIHHLVSSGSTTANRSWYIGCVLYSWKDESSSFLTLAIDLGLKAYVDAHFTRRSVYNKEGRPMLDYILRPRFGHRPFFMCIGNKMPDLKLLKAALEFGADPNQIYRGVSVWALFLCFIGDVNRSEALHGEFADRQAYSETLEVMIKNGADVILPGTWLASSAYFESYSRGNWYQSSNSVGTLERRFPDVKPIKNRLVSTESLFAVSDLLEHFSDSLGFKVDVCKRLALQREAQTLASQPR